MKMKTPNKNKRSWKMNTSAMTTNLKQDSKLNLKQGSEIPKFGQRNGNKGFGKLNIPNRRLSMPKFGQQQDKNVPKFGQRNENTQFVNGTLIEQIRKLDIRVMELEKQKSTTG